MHINMDWFDTHLCSATKCYSFFMRFFKALFTYSAMTCIFNALEECWSPLGHTENSYLFPIHTATCSAGAV